MIPRLYLDSPLACNSRLQLAEEETHRLRTVLRRKVGDSVRLFNEKHGEYEGRLVKLEKKHAEVELVHQIRPGGAKEREVHLLFCPLKKDALDFLIEKATELGVTHLHPIQTQHSQTQRLNGERLEAQVRQAAEQCQRLSIPYIEGLKPLAAALEKLPKNKFWGDESGQGIPVSGAFAGHPQPAAFIIGPEGGFSDEERMFLRKKATAVDLGPRILRAETAALAILSFYQNFLPPVSE